MLNVAFLLYHAAVFCVGVSAAGITGDVVQQRMTEDIEAGRPLVAHVVVALCDNLYQGIQPVPDFLGKGDDPDGNLYWGAMYGVRYFLLNKGGWRKVAHGGPKPEGVLERLILSRTTVRANGADAWEGRRTRATAFAWPPGERPSRGLRRA